MSKKTKKSCVKYEDRKDKLSYHQENFIMSSDAMNFNCSGRPVFCDKDLMDKLSVSQELLECFRLSDTYGSRHKYHLDKGNSYIYTKMQMFAEYLLDDVLPREAAKNPVATLEGIWRCLK